MTAHTPGPWVSEGRSVRRDSGLGYGEMIASVTGGAKSGPFFVEDDEECEANARLIAAAPDLLEALEAVWAALDEDSLEVMDLSIIRLAIAKAKA